MRHDDQAPVRDLRGARDQLVKHDHTVKRGQPVGRDQTVTLSGRVDVRTVGDLRTRLHSAIDTGHGPLRVDVAGLELGDDAALGVLFGAHRRARSRGRSMVLVSVPAPLGRLFGRHRLASLLRIEDAHACGEVCAEACGDPYAHVGHA